MTFEELNKLFRSKGRTLGSVESFTGGLFASKVTSIPGASHFFKGGIVTYATEEKVRLLGIDYDDVDKTGVVSKEIATQMASKGKMKMAVDYCVSFTGNAGPDAMEGKPAGCVYIAVATREYAICGSFQLSGDRHEVQEQACQIACDMLENLMEKFN